MIKEHELMEKIKNQIEEIFRNSTILTVTEIEQDYSTNTRDGANKLSLSLTV